MTETINKLCPNCENDLHYEGELCSIRTCGCKIPMVSVSREVKYFGAKKSKFTRADPKKMKPWN